MMSDDLIKRLRYENYCETACPTQEAADRIEQLEGQCVVYAEWDKARVDYINDLETKLAKAVAALRKLDRRNDMTFFRNFEEFHANVTKQMPDVVKYPEMYDLCYRLMKLTWDAARAELEGGEEAAVTAWRGRE